jgi:predicted nucleic acid-binding protein
MKVVVNDASVIIDLLYVGLIDEFFTLPYVFHVSDFTFHEITRPDEERLAGFIDKGVLNLRKFTAQEIREILTIRLRFPGFSVSDSSCIWLSVDLRAVLLTGEKKMRKVAEIYGIESHGTLWVFKELGTGGLIDNRKASSRLARLLEINSRLPRAEVEKLIREWKR